MTPERVEKTTWIMEALAEGWPDAKVIEGAPPDDGAPFVVWGQCFLSERIVPRAIEQGRPFWHVDNGFWNSAKGSKHGTYRFTYRGVAATFLRNAPANRAAKIIAALRPWRKAGGHVVIALPGPMFGACAGLDMRPWSAAIEGEVKARTARRILTRPKGCWRPLGQDLLDAWALVTHSSNVAIDAAVRGIPVFVEPTSPALPVGNLGLDIENPAMPDREAWLASLSCQQFLLDEMRSGEAYHYLSMVEAQAGGGYIRPDPIDGQGQGSAFDWRSKSAER